MTLEDKKRIYRLVQRLGPFEEPEPLARIGKKLIDAGIDPKSLGYAKMKQLFLDLPEFVDLKMVNIGENPHPMVTFHPWEEVAQEEAVPLDSEPMPTEDSDAGNPTASLPQPKAEPTAPSDLARGEEVPAPERTPPTQQQRREIYQLLTAHLSLEEQHHMAAVSKIMVDGGHTKERYGYAKMKPLLMSMGEFLSFEEIVINGVPQTLIAIHEVPQWQAQAAQTPQDTYERLPLEMEQGVYLPPKSLSLLNSFVLGYEGVPSEQLVGVLRADYAAARAQKAFWMYKDAYCFALSLTDPQGQPLCAAIRASDYEGGAWAKPWYLNFVGFNRSQPGKGPGQALEQFAHLGQWHVFLESLAKRAIREPWDFQGDKSYFILKKYIQYTFYRLQLEDKICFSEQEDFAAFNTGLVTEHYDDIYACFEPCNDGWRFIDFCTAASRGLGKRLVNAFNPLPQPASYFERKEDLLFDLDKDLHTDYEHILLDNTSRLPLAFLREECHGDAEAQRLIRQIEQLDATPAQRAAYEALSNLIAETPRLFNRLRNRLDDAIELARKQVRWNFKTAIPCFFPTRNVMSLMLPLSLCENGKADVALVVELTRSGNYQGQTILTLQQAYVDARLLCQPNSVWLDAQDIEQGLEE